MAVHLTLVSVSDGGGGKKTTTSTRPTVKKNLVYDPKTGLWVPATAKTITSTTSNKTHTSTSTGTKPSTQKTGDSSPNVDSQKDADKEYIEAEFNVLTGEMRLTPTSKSIRIRVNDTVKIEGLGKYLSGLYFVSAISRKINADSGYSHSFTLIKNGFGSSVKSIPPAPQSEPRKEEVVKPTPEYKVGDKVKIVAENAVYSNASEGVRVPSWVKQKTLTIYQVSDDKTRVLLKEIWSWTYVKYIQKV